MSSPMKSRGVRTSTICTFGLFSCATISLVVTAAAGLISSLSATGRSCAAGGGPVLDAVMVETDIAAAEILQSVKTEIGIPRAAAAVDDDFASWIETRRAEYLLDAVRRDEILGIVVA